MTGLIRVENILRKGENASVSKGYLLYKVIKAY